MHFSLVFSKNFGGNGLCQNCDGEKGEKEKGEREKGGRATEAQPQPNEGFLGFF